MRAVLVFAKQPLPGSAKTRLARVVGDERAAALAEAFLLDTLEHVASAAVTARARLVLLHDPASAAARSFFEGCARRLGIELDLAPQLPGADLGARLARAFSDALSRHETAVAIGTDSPEIAPGDYVEAFAALDRSPAVLGPASDGGYWLVGLRAGSGGERAFESEIAWSTSRAFADTRTAFEKVGIVPGILGVRDDVDDVDALEGLRSRLELDRSLAPRTAQALLSGSPRGTRLS